MKQRFHATAYGSKVLYHPYLSAIPQLNLSQVNNAAFPFLLDRRKTTSQLGRKPHNRALEALHILGINLSLQLLDSTLRGKKNALKRKPLWQSPCRHKLLEKERIKAFREYNTKLLEIGRQYGRAQSHRRGRAIGATC